MAENPLNLSFELRATEGDWRRLNRHLFPGDGDEHGAVLLCGVARYPEGARLLVRDVVLAEDGRDYVPGKRGYRHLTGEFVTHQARRAKDEGLAYLALHNQAVRRAWVSRGPTSSPTNGPTRPSWA